MDEFSKSKRFHQNAVLNRTNETYSKIIDIDGTQPYYWYQGIGSLVNGSINPAVTHFTIPVSYEGETLFHTL